MIRMILNFILMTLMYGAVRYIFTPRFSLWVQLASQFIALPVLWIVCSLIENMSVLRVLIGLVIMMAYGIVLYREKWYKTCAMIILLLTLDMLLEAGMLLAFPIVAEQGIESLPIRIQILTDVFYILAAVFVLFFVVALFRHKKGYGIDVLTDKDTMLFTLFPLSQLLAIINIIHAISTEISSGDIISISTAIIICLLADILLIRLVRRTAYNAELRAQNKALAEQVETTSNYYRVLTEQHETVRRMRHDIENHMYTIKILLEEGKVDEASKYAEELRKRQAEDYGLSACKNSVVSSFLYGRFKDAAAEGHRINARISLAEYGKIENVDLICAFGNVLDNALEACRAIPESSIELDCSSRNGYLYIETANPFVPKQKKARRIPELQRGIGTKILEGLAEKYNGVFCSKEENGIYSVSLIMKEENEIASDSNM